MAEKKTKKRKSLGGEDFEHEMKKQKIEKSRYITFHMEKIYKWLSENGKIVKSPEEKESLREKIIFSKMLLKDS